MTDPQSNTVLPAFLNFTSTHNNISRSNLVWPIQALLLQKSWDIWKKLICKHFLKQGHLGIATLEEPLGPFLQTHNNHHTWRWEQTGTTSIVENMHLFREHQQKHYVAHLTRHQIKVIRKDILHKVQPTLHSYPITMQQSTSTTLVFACPHGAYDNFNLPKTVNICNPLGSGASTVMNTSSFNNHTQADLHAIQAVSQTHMASPNATPSDIQT
jgi:hypothetical protein